MRYTINHFNQDYPDDNACLSQVFQNRYENIETCPTCDKPFKYHKVNGRKCYACQFCGNQLHPLANTIFHKSSVPLKSWFYAIYLFSVSKNGVSAKELQRHLGINYQTAHRMCHQIRKLMEDDNGLLDGNVEVDETYIGGKRRGNPGRYSNKSIIFGAVEREGKVYAKHVQSNGSRSLISEITNNIKFGATIHSDEWLVYKDLDKIGYNHTTVSHKNFEYVCGVATTNTIEGFWSQLKRSIDGTFHMISPKYMQGYVNEFAFRYNYRDGNAFGAMLANIAGKRA
jgi:transposase-like protein